MVKQIWLEEPVSEDGTAVNQLVERCAPLDTNSAYCNILQCDHFSETSVIAKTEHDVIGFISGYKVPQRPNTLFVWQVAVDQRERGTGLASRMLDSLLHRSRLSDVEYIETTITADNQPSWKLFNRLADRLNTRLEKSEHYQSASHFAGEHDSEWLVRIGPIRH